MVKLSSNLIAPQNIPPCSLVSSIAGCGIGRLQRRCEWRPGERLPREWTVVVVGPGKEAPVVLGPRQFARNLLFLCLTPILQQVAPAQTTFPPSPRIPSNLLLACGDVLPRNFAGVDRRLASLELGAPCRDYEEPPSHAESRDASSPIPASKIANVGSLDPVRTELLSLGKRGREVSAAREFILGILEENNACSAWYLAKEPDAVAIFRSLHLALDSRNPGLVRKLMFSDENWEYVHPYVARAQQNVGPGSTITINEHGAFFEDAAGVVVVRSEGGPAVHETARQLYVGNYRGATQPARVLTLLHEFGHIIDLLPFDAGSPTGPEISMLNSRLVIQHCKPEIEASARKPKAGPPALAATLAPLSPR